ncbi:EcsC family protein [Acetobacteraceae bacterium H6797]|nr:EcsC family protein [Acetobacteraceae bacterium H6797]
MSLTLSLPEEARLELKEALTSLEHQSLAARLAGMAGTPIEALKRRLPDKAQAMLDGAIKRALDTALRAALRSDPSKVPVPSVSGSTFHRGLAALTGAAGGALGLPGTLLELPVSTTLLLRQIAAEAAAQGEDLGDIEVAAECLKVFALGSNDPADDAAETGYFAARLALAQGVPQLAAQSINTLLPGFVSAIAARFAGPMTLKLTAQAAPFLGAAAGAAVNLAFLEHFKGVARGHFTIRRLERLHGVSAVREAAAGMRAG